MVNASHFKYRLIDAWNKSEWKYLIRISPVNQYSLPPTNKSHSPLPPTRSLGWSWPGDEILRNIIDIRPKSMDFGAPMPRGNCAFRISPLRPPPPPQTLLSPLRATANLPIVVVDRRRPFICFGSKFGSVLFSGWRFRVDGYHRRRPVDLFSPRRVPTPAPTWWRYFDGRRPEKKCENQLVASFELDLVKVSCVFNCLHARLDFRTAQLYFSHFRGFRRGFRFQYPTGDVMRAFPFSSHISPWLLEGVGVGWSGLTIFFFRKNPVGRGLKMASGQF